MISARDPERLRPFLLPGERVLWSGRPPQGILFRRADLSLVPLSLLFAMAAFWFDAIVPQDAPFPFRVKLWAARLAAIYLVVGRFLYDAWVRGRLLYAVTNRRILLLRTGPWPRVKSIEIGYLPLFEYEEHRGGLGTLRFDFEESGEPQASWLGHWRPEFWTARPTGMCFERIEQPRDVYDLIQRETNRWRQERYGDLSGPRGFVG